MRKKLECAECGEKLFKKDASVCQRCGRVFCKKHIYIYVDGSNAAITNNGPELCENCYKEEYGRLL